MEEPESDVEPVTSSGRIVGSERRDAVDNIRQHLDTALRHALGNTGPRVGAGRETSSTRLAQGERVVSGAQGDFWTSLGRSVTRALAVRSQGVQTRPGHVPAITTGLVDKHAAAANRQRRRLLMASKRLQRGNGGAQRAAGQRDTRQRARARQPLSRRTRTAVEDFYADSDDMRWSESLKLLVGGGGVVPPERDRSQDVVDAAAMRRVAAAEAELLVCAVCSLLHSVRSYGVVAEQSEQEIREGRAPVYLDPGHVPCEELTASYLEPLISKAIMPPTAEFPRDSVTVAVHNGTEYCLQTAPAAGCATWVEMCGPDSDDPSLASLRICRDCRSSLDAGKVPKRSLVTIDAGSKESALRHADFPRDLKEKICDGDGLVDLTMVEQDLISWTRAQAKLITCRSVG